MNKLQTRICSKLVLLRQVDRQAQCPESSGEEGAVQTGHNNNNYNNSNNTPRGINKKTPGLGLDP